MTDIFIMAFLKIFFFYRFLYNRKLKMTLAFPILYPLDITCRIIMTDLLTTNHF